MKKLALAVAALFLTGSALASPYNGFYAGGSVGYGTGDANQTRWSNTHGGAFVNTQNDASLDGWTVGAFAGHNWTHGSMVLGVEGNWDFGGPVGDDGEGERNEWDQKWEASLRGRVGFLFNPTTLGYVTAGYSWADYDANVLNAPTSSRSHTFGGWTYGAGLEFGLGGNMTGRVQYRHNEYDAERVDFTPDFYDIEAGPSIDSFSAGIAFHF
jgi:outer membrane immunogenic protein